MNNAEDDEPDADIDMLRKHASQLSEHFESVQIIVTKTMGTNGTQRISQGMGNWFARYGSVIDWLKVEEEKSKQEI